MLNLKVEDASLRLICRKLVAKTTKDGENLGIAMKAGSRKSVEGVAHLALVFEVQLTETLENG